MNSALDEATAWANETSRCLPLVSTSYADPKCARFPMSVSSGLCLCGSEGPFTALARFPRSALNSKGDRDQARQAHPSQMRRSRFKGDDIGRQDAIVEERHDTTIYPITLYNSPLLQEAALSPCAHKLAHDFFVYIRLVRDRGRRLGGFCREIRRPFGDNIVIILNASRAP